MAASVAAIFLLAMAAAVAAGEGISPSCSARALDNDPLGLSALLCEYDMAKLGKTPPPGAGSHYCANLHKSPGLEGSDCACGQPRWVHHNVVVRTLTERCEAAWRDMCPFISLRLSCYSADEHTNWVRECVIASWTRPPSPEVVPTVVVSDP